MSLLRLGYKKTATSVCLALLPLLSLMETSCQMERLLLQGIVGSQEPGSPTAHKELNPASSHMSDFRSRSALS